MFTIARLEPVPHWHPLRIAGRRLSQRSCSARAGRRDDRLRHGSAQRQTHGADWREPACLPIQGHFATLQDRSGLWAPPCSHLIVHATGETEAFGESTDAGRRLKYRPPPNPREPLRITAGEERFAPAARRRARAAPAPNLGARIVVGGHAGQRRCLRGDALVPRVCRSAEPIFDYAVIGAGIAGSVATRARHAAHPHRRSDLAFRQIPRLPVCERGEDAREHRHELSRMSELYGRTVGL